MSTRTGRLAGLSTVALAVTVSLGVGGLAPGAAAGQAAPTDPARVGLYGAQDPTFDGVYRQSLTILALEDVGARVDQAAVRWLLDQQCPNGRWTSFRPQVDEPCGAGDTNATAVAVIALEAVGRNRAAARGLRWLVGQQAPGGGWEYTKGWGPDSNSTGLAVQALLAMGVRPKTVTNDGSAWDFLASVQLGCESDAADRGALDYQANDPLVANDYATAQAAQALARTSLPVQARDGTRALPTTPCVPTRRVADLAGYAAGYLGRTLRANEGLIPSVFGSGPDYGSTANAVLALVASGYGSRQVGHAMRALEAEVRRYVLDDDRRVLPAAGALMVLAEQATGGDPRDVDGVNLVRRLQRSVTR